MIKVYALYDDEGNEVDRGTGTELEFKYNLGRTSVCCSELKGTKLMRKYKVKVVDMEEKKVFQYTTVKNFEILHKGTYAQIKKALGVRDEELKYAIKNKTMINGITIFKELVSPDRLESFNVKKVVSTDDRFEELLDHLKTYHNTILAYKYKNKIEEYKKRLIEEGIDANFIQKRDEYGKYYVVVVNEKQSKI